MKKILVIGQTPPPFGGQAMMIKRMLDGDYKNATLYHVDMSFSKEMDQMGKFSFSKLFQPFIIVAKTIHLKFKHNIPVLYYPPSGPSFLPILRDIVLLLSVRWMFKKTIFHFHAAGMSEFYNQLPWILKIPFKLAYFKPDIAIQLSEYNPNDAASLEATTTCFIPNGIEDDYLEMHPAARLENSVCTILFVGMISESKGVLVLVEAIKLLHDNGIQVKVCIVGKFASESFKKIVYDKLSDYNIQDLFEFTGVLTGLSKNERYLAADIFCFPTFFECESFGLVAVEAMQFGLPVVLSRWRGLQSLIEDGEQGFFAPAQDPVVLADKLTLLVNDAILRKSMGMKGREKYLQKYTADAFYRNMDECFGKL